MKTMYWILISIAIVAVIGFIAWKQGLFDQASALSVIDPDEPGPLVLPVDGYHADMPITQAASNTPSVIGFSAPPPIVTYTPTDEPSATSGNTGYYGGGKPGQQL